MNDWSYACIAKLLALRSSTAPGSRSPTATAPVALEQP